MGALQAAGGAWEQRQGSATPHGLRASSPITSVEKLAVPGAVGQGWDGTSTTGPIWEHHYLMSRVTGRCSVLMGRREQWCVLEGASWLGDAHKQVGPPRGAAPSPASLCSLLPPQAPGRVLRGPVLSCLLLLKFMCLSTLCFWAPGELVGG